MPTADLSAFVIINVCSECTTKVMSMDPTEILTRAKMGPDTPPGWIVLPLVRSKAIWAIIGWSAGVVIGALLFAGFAYDTVPYNYQQSVFGAIFSTVVLALLAFVTLGSAWALISDILRLRDADRHIIVITPEDFVKQEGEKIIHVPLYYVQYVTARGTPPPDRSTANIKEETRIPTLGENIVGLFAGRGFTSSGMRWRRRRMRTPTTLAFMDARTNEEVLVATDSAYGDPFLIAAHLKQYAAAAQER